MEGLNLDNILDEQDFISFSNNEETTPGSNEETTEEREEKEDKTTEVNPNSLFEGEPESVGSEEDNKEGKGESPLDNGDSTSPKSNFFSSIAEAFAEEGILPNLDEETIKNIKTPEDFRKAIDDYLKSEMTEQQQRVTEALNNNVEVDAIRQYEGVISYLNSIDEAALKEEGEEGENLRKRLMFQDYVNRGFDEKRAEKEVNRSLSNGTDIEDALDALEGCKSFYQTSYKKLLQEAKDARAQEEKDRKQRETKFKDTIMNSKNNVFDGVELDSATRQKVFDNITKPIYKDPKTGEAYTAIQKYELDNSDDFLIKLGVLFTITDGFKNIDKLVGSKVKKGVKKGLRDLESRINNTSRDSLGNLRYTSGTEDSETYLGKGITLAL